MLSVLVFFIIKEDFLKKESIIQCVENSRKDAARRATEIDRERERDLAWRKWAGYGGQAGYVGMWVRVQAEPASIPAEEPWMAVY